MSEDQNLQILNRSVEKCRSRYILKFKNQSFRLQYNYRKVQTLLNSHISRKEPHFSKRKMCNKIRLELSKISKNKCFDLRSPPCGLNEFLVSSVLSSQFNCVFFQPFYIVLYFKRLTFDVVIVTVANKEALYTLKKCYITIHHFSC